MHSVRTFAVRSAAEGEALLQGVAAREEMRRVARALAGVALAALAPAASATTVLPDQAGEGLAARDIASVSASFDTTTLFLGVGFVAPPDFGETAVFFRLDTTGDASDDFFVFFNPLANASEVFVIDQATASKVGMGSASFGGSEFMASVALSLVGGDGSVLFAAESGAPVAPGEVGVDPELGGFVVSDAAPTPSGEVATAFVLGGPATVIPEPATGLLAALGLAGLAAVAARRR